MTSPFRVDIDEHIAQVVLTSPKGRNMMTPIFFTELQRIFEELDRDEEVRSIVLSAEGKAFSYGLSLMEFAGDLARILAGPALAPQRTELLQLVERLQATFTTLERCRKPIVAAVHGWCIGGGIELISCCDIRVCSADSKFSFRETKLAIVADLGGLQRLPIIVGKGHAREMVMTSRDVDAQRAMRIGLVNDVYETREATIEAATEIARQIAANPPLVVQGAKQVMNFSEGRPVADGLAYVATWNSAFLKSEDLGEAVSAFAEKREPDFKGR